jgi:hypothetical protein
MPAQGRAKTIAEPANAARVSLVEPQGGRPLLRLFGLASITVSFLAASSAPTPLYATYQAAWGHSGQLARGGHLGPSAGCRAIRRAEYGAFMEPRGCNRWQSLATRLPLETAKTSEIRCDWPPPDGKEGVDGSSPSEGFAKCLLINFFCLPAGRRLRLSASTERPRPGATAFCVGWNRSC